MKLCWPDCEHRKKITETARVTCSRVAQGSNNPAGATAETIGTDIISVCDSSVGSGWFLRGRYAQSWQHSNIIFKQCQNNLKIIEAFFQIRD